MWGIYKGDNPLVRYLPYNARFSSEATWKQNASIKSPRRSRTWTSGRRSCGGIFDFEGKEKRLTEVETLLTDPKVWNDPKRAQDLGREKKSLDATVTGLAAIASALRDSRGLFEMARAENDDATLSGIAEDVAKLEKEVGDLEFRRMFSDPQDPNNCFMDIQSGSGGTEAQDWAAMLERMYARYCDRKGYRMEVLEESPGEVAGIKSASLKISGSYAYGHLRTENGVHRLVRKSQFDSNARRHTSFASVFVYPEVDENIQVEVNPADLRIDTYRASGAGGQHVNKTDSAIRITHLPSGIVVQCQNDRSQHRNRDAGRQMLKSRLVERAEEEREAKMAKERGGTADTGFGGESIRSY